MGSTSCFIETARDASSQVARGWAATVASRQSTARLSNWPW